MRSATMSRARVLLAGLLLTCLAGSANAASILFSEVQVPGSTDINNLDPFTRTGNFSEEFVNNTGVRFTDWHVTFFFPTGVPDTDGDGFFDNSKTTFERSGSSLQFLTVNFNGGPGIAAGTHFIFSTSGFDPDTVFTITPTVPEPSSVLLGTTGLIGMGLLGLSRRRAGKRTA